MREHRRSKRRDPEIPVQVIDSMTGEPIGQIGNLSPDGGDKPTGDLADAIANDFGSFDKFQAHFTAAATTLQGSGWAILGYDTIGQRLAPALLREKAKAFRADPRVQAALEASRVGGTAVPTLAPGEPADLAEQSRDLDLAELAGVRIRGAHKRWPIPRSTQNRGFPL